MIYTSERGIRIIMIIFLLCLFWAVGYFIKGLQEINHNYDNLLQISDINNN